MYSARVIEKTEKWPGYGIRVGVFQTVDGSEKQVGEYFRNSLGLGRTFCPFHLNGRDLALYSPKKPATRIIELPSCKDLGGEEPEPDYFSPVDFYVPRYIEREAMDGELKGQKLSINEPFDAHLTANPSNQILYYPFGFVAGSKPGDDVTYKIQYLDLSQADQGVIKRDDRFGYIALPEKVTLEDAIHMSDYNYDPTDDESFAINIAVQQRFDLRTGKLVEY
jgi:hypothetical protein